MTLLGRAAFLIGGLAAGCLSASAAEWVPGGTFDIALGVPTFFVRYVAAEPGQMVVRCMAGEGVTIDAGATGAGPPPAGVRRDSVVDVRFAVFKAANAAAVGSYKGSGQARSRSDGSIVVTVAGEEIDALAKLLVQPLDHVDIAIGDAKATVTMATAAEKIARMAEACPGWPK
ncbi:MAG: hypothetical protein U1E56_04290 [Bauldia sp.]